MIPVLMIHNYYQSESPSGENASFEAELALLRRYKPHVITYIRYNDDIDSYSFWRRIRLAKQAIWAKDTYRALKDILKTERPVVAHIQNTFPLISPSTYKACSEAGVPVVQALRNYRLLCPNAQFFRDGYVCEV